MPRLLILALLVACLLPLYAQDGQPLQTFTLKELFGLSHPEQIIDFDLQKPAVPEKTYLLDAEGREVPCQVLAGGKKIAIRTDLPANTTRSWRLMTGKAPVPVKDGVSVAKTETYYEITNGLTGIRIPVVPADLKATPAPVQGVRYRDGIWTAQGPNYLTPQAKAMTVRFIEQGPLKVVVEVAYAYDRPEVRHKGSWDPPEGAFYPAGEGFYKSTIEVQAGQPSITFEEDTDMDVSYSLNIYAGLHPTQARYRGHHSNSVEAGREPDGQQYRMWHARPGMDALVDFKFDGPRSFRSMAVWDPWCFDTGWYWQMFDQNAPANSNLFGMFAGRASRTLGANGSGVNIFTDPTGGSDFTSKPDRQGNLHLLNVVNGAAWYTAIDKNLAPAAAVKAADSIINADLLVDEQGGVHIAAYDPARKAFVLAERGADGRFITTPIVFADSDRFNCTDPYIYQAASGTTHFLFLYGEENGKAGALLFARNFGEKTFAFQEWNRIEKGRVRPHFAALADGTVALLFSQGQYVEYASIKPGARTFAGTPAQQKLFGNEQTRILNFGSAFDERTGNFFASDHLGEMCFFTPEGQQGVTKLSLQLNHGESGPNRRTLATADDGQALAVQNGQFFRYRNGAWERFAPGDALKLTAPRVHYLPQSGLFLLIGRKDDTLLLYSWKPADASPTLTRTLDTADPRMVGIRVSTFRGVNQPVFHPHVRFDWGLFMGVKGENLQDPYKTQDIARQMNLHAGINLNKIAHMHLDFPDPPQGYGALYMDRKILQGMIEKLRADKSGMNGNGYYAYLRHADPLLPGIIDMWADPTGAKVQEAAAGITTLAKDLLNAMVYGDGIYEMRFHYWHGGLEMMRKGMWIDQVLADERISAEDREKVKAAAAFFAYQLWDDDAVPMFNGHGLNMGTENMPVQQQGYRAFYAMMLARHPAMQERAAEIEKTTLATLRQTVNEQGANISCTHYIGASMEPTVITLLAMRMQGKDHFADEPRLAKFADFYLNFLTPPEIRFGGSRKLVSTGDSPTEGSEMFGLLGTGFRTANPELSSRLMGAWEQNGKPHGFFFGSSLLMIDEAAPTKDPALGSATFPGYYSVLRNGWGTPNETGLWLINGTWYRDHYHMDIGALIAYALGAPLSIDWGSQGDPRTPSSYYHSLVLPEAGIGHPWNGDNPPLDNGFRWKNPVVDRFLAFTNSGLVRTTFDNTWTRTLYSLHPNERYPVLVMRDEYAKDARVFTLNLMADGPVDTPAGPITPALRSWKANELASAGQVFPLAPGINRFGFTGQQFGTPEKPVPAIDWDLFTIADAPQQAFIGNWAHNWCAGQNNEFKRVNNRDFEERQHILRIKGAGTLTTVILPYRKGEKRTDLKLTRDGANLRITAGGETMVIGEAFFAYQSPAKQVLAAFSNDSVQGAGLQVEGGPVEITVEGDRATISVHGVQGPRTITLPGTWKPVDPKAPLMRKAGTWVLNYTGEAPLRVELRKER